MRVADESGNTNYWQAMGKVPVEDEWRSNRLSMLPPPSGAEPLMTWGLPASSPSVGIASPDGVGRLPMPWGGPDGADRRLVRLAPRLLNGNPSNWSLIATHVPGRSGAECKRRWGELEAAALAQPRWALAPSGASRGSQAAAHSRSRREIAKTVASRVEALIRRLEADERAAKREAMRVEAQRRKEARPTKTVFKSVAACVEALIRRLESEEKIAVRRAALARRGRAAAVRHFDIDLPEGAHPGDKIDFLLAAGASGKITRYTAIVPTPRSAQVPLKKLSMAIPLTPGVSATTPLTIRKLSLNGVPQA